LGEIQAPSKKMKGRWCSSSASISGILRRCSGKVEGAQWWRRRESSSMALVRERSEGGEWRSERGYWEEVPR